MLDVKQSNSFELVLYEDQLCAAFDHATGYAVLFPAFLFRKCRVWNSLSQGHDDEQHTTIFQKALLVANQVWMGLSEPNTQKAPP